MINELVFFGCSHSVWDWDKLINIPNVKFTNHAEGGSSNELILKKIKKWIIENQNNYDNKVLVIQFSYLNRQHIFYEPTESEFKVHGFNQIQYHNEIDDFAKDKISKYYNLWLKWFFNPKYEFDKLLLEIQLLKKIFDDNGIKYVWYLFDNIAQEEINQNISYNTIEMYNVFDELGFIKFDDTYFCCDWAEKNKLRNCDAIDGGDKHLDHMFGRPELAKILKNNILKKLEI